MQRSLNYVRYMLAVVLLTACAQLGLEQADTFDKKLAYAYGQTTGFRQAATMGVNQRKLSSDEGTAILKLTDDTRVFLDAAKMAPDITKAQTNLTLALGVLVQIQNYLNTRGVK